VPWLSFRQPDNNYPLGSADLDVLFKVFFSKPV
jgi:hypothetical protein